MTLARLSLCLVLNLCVGVLQAQTRVHLLDVGEGQSMLLSHDDRGVLIDTGHAGEAPDLLQTLEARGVDRLDFILLTHLHPDHASGYFRIREAFPDTPVISNCHPLPEAVSPDMTRWVRDALARDPLHRCTGAGEQLRFGELQIRVLWPEGFDGHDLNHHSLVLHLVNTEGTAGHGGILVMGDAGVRAERALLRKQALPSDVDVLVVGHHGAEDATGDALLDRVTPERAVISVNRDNVRGYPASQVIERLRGRDIPLRQTAIHGDIEIRAPAPVMDPLYAK